MTIELRYDVETGQKVDAVIKPWKKGRSPHQRAFSGEVLSVAVSPDNRILATGGRDKLVRLFDLRMDSNQPIAHTEPAADPSLAAFRLGKCHLFHSSSDRCASRGHKDYITSLAFDLDASSTLYSASADRTWRDAMMESSRLTCTRLTQSVECKGQRIHEHLVRSPGEPTQNAKQCTPPVL